MRNTHLYGPTVALCLGTHGDTMGVGVSYEQSTPVVSMPNPRRARRSHASLFGQNEDPETPAQIFAE